APAVIGTINYRFKNKVFTAGNTTPPSARLQSLLSQMQQAGVDYVIAEVSSHALDQERVRGIKFCAGIFTNLTVDHLDYHHDLDSYFIAKSKLFKGLPKHGFAILNIDDLHARKLIKLTKASIITYGLSDCADVGAQVLNSSLNGQEFILWFSPQVSERFTGGVNQLKVTSRLIGKHNLYNILAAVAFALTQKINLKIIKSAIIDFNGVPGRLERVTAQNNFFVFVDYAHTEDALASVIKALRPLCKGRLYVVFGCGGQRDRSKRPGMGRVVCELADFAIITTDNPRNEDPLKIIDDIIPGINKQNFKIIIQRKKAIKEALSMAKKDDIILIAGKGHENYQVFKNRVIHFDDREVTRQCFESKK
ncbi:MAG: UDP-N-acetylmuramoyl-L-alanyl-D-glutamate--2,6-diaminopimelate ligase, partial [Candidatus Omnitrophota bacterium]